MGAHERELTPGRSGRDFFGSEMRHHRKEADLSIGELAVLVQYSKTHLANIETATRTPPPDLPGLLDVVLPESAGIFSRVYPLVESEAFADWARRYMKLEPLANTHDSYSLSMPGLWHTEEYGLAFLRLGLPRASEEEIRERWELRKARQRILARKRPPFVWMVLDELAVRRMVGGPGVMGRQIDHVLALADGRDAVVQILPLARSHGAMGGSLTLLHFDDAPRVAYLEGVLTGQLIESPAEVADMALIYDQIRTAALTPAETVAWLRTVREEYRE